MIKFVHICITEYAQHYALQWQTNGKHTHPNQNVKIKMLQCYGIKEYTQREKLQQIDQI
jgi:hypothetical protein